VTGPEDLAQYLKEALLGSLARFDLPLLYRCFEAARGQDESALISYGSWVLAGRETQELFQAEMEMGRALGRLIQSLGAPGFWSGTDLGYVATFALLASLTAPNLTLERLGLIYAHAFLENQLAAASRVTRLGQTAGRLIILSLGETVARAVKEARDIPNEEIGSRLWGLALLSSWHETMGSRLFRS
jgi:urease accessory protein